MSEVTYTLDFAVRHRGGQQSEGPCRGSKASQGAIPRIARLMALAIRLDGLIRDQTLPDYAAVAQRGRVTRARMTQIMKLLHLAPDLQEQILFLPPSSRLTERHLRPIVRHIDWHEQRRLFRELTFSSARHSAAGASCEAPVIKTQSLRPVARTLVPSSSSSFPEASVRPDGSRSSSHSHPGRRSSHTGRPKTCP